jgi:hypothetical protein
MRSLNETFSKIAFVRIIVLEHEMHTPGHRPLMDSLAVQERAVLFVHLKYTNIQPVAQK